MSRAERIAKQLGMSQGAANNKLRKTLLFVLAQRTKLDNCFKCNEKIKTVEEFSIEHKQPWEGRSTELFWDLDNIAFSHVSCNRPHSNGALKLRKECPEGQSWCNRCKQFLEKSLFDVVKTRWNGVHGFCKSCKSVTAHTARDAR